VNPLPHIVAVGEGREGDMIAKACRVFAGVWTSLVLAFIGACVLVHLVFAKGPLVEAMLDVLGWFSPLNLLNWTLTVVLLLPAIAASVLSEKLGK